MLHCAIGGVKGMSGDSDGNGVACNPNDFTIH
jgi:hypothetical protein